MDTFEGSRIGRPRGTPQVGYRTDATPGCLERPCLHPRADHQHGTVAAYRGDGCRCQRCTEANVAARRARAQQRMNDRWAPYVPAEPVRDHLQRLRSAGVGVDRIAQLAGLSGSTVREVIYGRNGRLFQRIRSRTATRLLGISPQVGDRSERSTVDAAATRAAIEALRSQGFAWTVIAGELGRSARNLRRTVRRSTVTVKTAADVARLCRSLEANGSSESETAIAG